MALWLVDYPCRPHRSVALGRRNLGRSGCLEALVVALLALHVVVFGIAWVLALFYDAMTEEEPMMAVKMRGRDPLPPLWNPRLPWWKRAWLWLRRWF